MATYRWCPNTKTHVLKEDWFFNCPCGNPHGGIKHGESAMIMPDLQPYQAVAGDMAFKEVSGRKAHREFLRRNNFIEVGNEREAFFRHGGKTDDNPTRKW